MTPSITATARATWARLPPRDFDAIADLRASLDDVADTGSWSHIYTLSELTLGATPVRVVETRSLLLMIDADQIEIFAIGRPGL